MIYDPYLEVRLAIAVAGHVTGADAARYVKIDRDVLYRLTMTAERMLKHEDVLLSIEHLCNPDMDAKKKDYVWDADAIHSSVLNVVRQAEANDKESP